MKIYNALTLRKSELEKLEQSLGGKYSFLERLRRGGIGSPMMYYLKGNDQLDQLQQLASDEIRINIELLKNGLFVRIAERTNIYFIAFPEKAIVAMKLSKEENKTILAFEAEGGIHFMLWGAAESFDAWKKFVGNSFLSNDKKITSTFLD